MDDTKERHCIDQFLNGPEIASDCIPSFLESAKRTLLFLLKGNIRNEDLKDLAHETVARAWTARKSFRADSGFDAWLSGVARNVGREWARKRARSAKTVSIEDLTTPVDPPASDDVAGEARFRLLLLAAKLSPQEAKVARLLLSGAGSQADIGKMLGIEENAVKMTARRLREKLKPFFGLRAEDQGNE